MSAITSAESKLGIVGIGYMGRPIAQRLLESGFRLIAYDRHHTKAEELIRYGGTVEPPRVWRRLQLLRRWSHDEQDNEQVFA